MLTYVQILYEEILTQPSNEQLDLIKSCIVQHPNYDPKKCRMSELVNLVWEKSSMFIGSIANESTVKKYIMKIVGENLEKCNIASDIAHIQEAQESFIKDTVIETVQTKLPKEEPIPQEEKLEAVESKEPVRLNEIEAPKNSGAENMMSEFYKLEQALEEVVVVEPDDYQEPQVVTHIEDLPLKDVSIIEQTPRETPLAQVEELTQIHQIEEMPQMQQIDSLPEIEALPEIPIQEPVSPAPTPQPFPPVQEFVQPTPQPIQEPVEYTPPPAQEPVRPAPEPQPTPVQEPVRPTPAPQPPPIQAVPSEPQESVYEHLADPLESAKGKRVSKELSEKVIDIVRFAHSKDPGKQYFKIFYLKYVQKMKQGEIATELAITEEELCDRYLKLVRIVKNGLNQGNANI